MRLIVLLLSLSAASAAHGALVEVSPGPGTPLQDAVDSAAPGDRLLLHAGSYLETVVIDKSLRILADGDVTIGPELGPLQSSCAPAFVLDVTAGTVRIDGARATSSTGYIHIQGGGSAAVRVRGGAKAQFTKLTAVTFCPGGSGLSVQDVALLKMAKCGFTSFSTTAIGAPGCRITQPSGRVMMKESGCDGRLLGQNAYGGPGLLIDDVPSPTGRATVKISRGFFTSCGDAGAALRSAGGVQISRSQFQACPRILGGPRYDAITLDAASSGNFVRRSKIVGPILDDGTANCFRGNVDENGAPLPDGCS